MFAEELLNGLSGLLFGFRALDTERFSSGLNTLVQMKHVQNIGEASGLGPFP